RLRCQAVETFIASESKAQPDTRIHRHGRNVEPLRSRKSEAHHKLTFSDGDAARDAVVIRTSGIEIPSVLRVAVEVRAIPLALRQMRDDRLVLTEIARREPSVAVYACRRGEIGAKV